jgi:hypothetical protein
LTAVVFNLDGEVLSCLRCRLLYWFFRRAGKGV